MLLRWMPDRKPPETVWKPRYQPPDLTPRELLILEGRASPGPGEAEHAADLRAARP
ncbi:MAG: hypothetical protein OXF93_15980 [Acidobacteria bacterium]|nr:hypothetical protein [Acidobacteriota bacterium]